MIQPVTEDDIARLDETPDRSDVGCEAGGEEDGVGGSLKLGQRSFEFGMQRSASTDQRTGAGSGSMAGGRVESRSNHTRVTCQTEVVVGCEVDEFDAIDAAPSLRKWFADSRVSAQASFVQSMQCVSDPVEGHRNILSDRTTDVLVRR